jgi:hypothetical protein
MFRWEKGNEQELRRSPHCRALQFYESTSVRCNPLMVQKTESLRGEREESSGSRAYVIRLRFYDICAAQTQTFRDGNFFVVGRHAREQGTVLARRGNHVLSVSYAHSRHEKAATEK